MTFEEAISRLEEIVNMLESNTLSLEKSLELFQQGIALVNLCNTKLKEAEGTVEILLKDRDGQLKEEPFNIDDRENGNEFQR
ncbi:MAG TPA: exodeoxyribonuclease VII small subunit [Clostridiales bacterium]|nr:exodeoxyribonuclease VII small subunit [Clostridiales bacterium]